jgi:hypothetical protein
METTRATGPDAAAERLIGEVADVEASIALVSSGVASRVTLTGLRFGQQVAERLGAVAARQGVDLEASFWPDDTACDIRVSLAAPVADA